MLSLIVVCSLLVLLTVAIHAGGTSLWVWVLIRKYANHEGMIAAWDRWCLFILTALVLMTMHLVEVFLWAITLLKLPAVTQIETFEQALYYSMVTFTTLGYGDITLNPGMRWLSGGEAMNGILLFGWSTAFFFGVMQRAWKMGGEGD